MRGQWSLIIGLIVAILIAVFAVINVDAVRVNYLFGHAEWPLILVILGSVFMGAIVAGTVGMLRIYQLQAEIKRVKKQSVTDSNAIESASPSKEGAIDKGNS
ncbi:LapA family protein [Halalkalibacter alkalisediminis]|uniref:Lipopolysaccharide assembly LapA domain-containing protein n=1 Tax=Halalkalibacter alkalisediminis TaxID=935616 RepID=A0ABV6NM54_9BACI|nr:lipopolysaccharide assembly protein LapA domain-containing protein [Halalkalibacter alkalisediminis]